jgi:hypothetical protein
MFDALASGGRAMRFGEKTIAIIILALAAWAVIMVGATRFEGSESNRILRVELGASADQLSQAVAARDSEGIANNIHMVERNTQMDYVLILLYWLAFVGLAMVAARRGAQVLGVFAVLFITGAAVGDVLENEAILTAMQVRPFLDTVAADVSECSQWKWSFFFIACVVLGLAFAMNRRVSRLRRLAGGLFIASGAFGLLGIARYRVSLEFTLVMIDVAILLVAAALLVTLWKVYRSIKVPAHNEALRQVQAHA